MYTAMARDRPLIRFYAAPDMQDAILHWQRWITDERRASDHTLAAYSRDLPAGTILGSGTVANENYSEVGSSCIAERRAIEQIESGEGTTPFLADGDVVTMEAHHPAGGSIFGQISQGVAIKA